MLLANRTGIMCQSCVAIEASEFGHRSRWLVKGWMSPSLEHKNKDFDYADIYDNWTMSDDDESFVVKRIDLSSFRYVGAGSESSSQASVKVKTESTKLEQAPELGTAYPGGILPPLLKPYLYVVFIGFNPGLESAKQGHYYAHRSNRFWKLIYESGLVDEPMTARDDHRLPQEYGYGFTDLVARSTRGITELTTDERLEGARLLEERLVPVSPDFVCFVGKGIWETVCKFKGWSTADFTWGLQPPQKLFASACIFVVPSTSGLVSIPKEVQLKYWQQLKDQIDGVKPESGDVTFKQF